MKKILTRTAIAIMLAFFATVMISVVPQPLTENCYSVKGKIVEVASPCCQDVVFWLEGDENDYYINRGVESGIDVQEWNQILRSQEVNLQVFRRNWSPLDLFIRLHPVAQVKMNNQLIYNVVIDS